MVTSLGRRVPLARSSVRPRLLACGLVLLCAHLLWPAFTSVHVEGFSAQIQSLALILGEQGSIAPHDLARPIVTEFIFVTRPGVVDLLAGADRLFGYTGDAGFRMLCVLSLAGVLAGSVFVAWRSGQVSPWMATLACILTPGLTELGFFFNDNLVSAGFGLLALAAGLAGSATGSAALAGVLLGMSILCRLDAALLLPFLVLLVLAQRQPFNTMLSRLLVMLFALLATHCVAAWINRVSVLDVLRIPKTFVELVLVNKKLPGVTPTLYFLGPIASVLIPAGALAMWRRRPVSGWRGWAWLGAFYVYPLAVMVYVLLTVTEIRYILPLLGPVVALHGGAGLQLLGHALGDGPGWPRRCAYAVCLFFALISAMPPLMPQMHDGPRAIVGRLWMPLLWVRWQGSVRDSMRTVDNLIDATEQEPRATVITAQWNDEFYLRLKLFERGYREVPPPLPCRTMSLYRNGGHEVWHVRLHPQYGVPPFERPLATAIVLAEMGQCPAIVATSRRWVTTFGSVPPEAVANGVSNAQFQQPLYETLWRTPDRLNLTDPPYELGYRVMRAAPLSPAEFAQWVTRAQAVVAVHAARLGDTAPALTDRYVQAFKRHRDSAAYTFIMQKILRRAPD